MNITITFDPKFQGTLTIKDVAIIEVRDNEQRLSNSEIAAKYMARPIRDTPQA